MSTVVVGLCSKALAGIYFLLHGGKAANVEARLARLGLPGVSGVAFPEWGMTLDDPGVVQRMCSFVRSHRRVELLPFYSGASGGTYDLARRPGGRCTAA
jgi:hypothetical protein